MKLRFDISDIHREKRASEKQYVVKSDIGRGDFICGECISFDKAINEGCHKT